MGYGQTGYWEKWEPEIGGDIDCVVRLTKDYATFINKQNDVDWATTEEFDEITGEDHWRTINEVVGEGYVIDCDMSSKLDLTHKRAVRELILIAISHALENCADLAKAKLLDARNYAGRRNAELARRWIIIFTLHTLLIFVIFLGSFLFILGTCSADVRHSLFAILGGVVGAALSLITRTTKLDLDVHAGEDMFYLEVFCRLLVGSISGFFVYGALQMGVLSIQLSIQNDGVLGGYALPLFIGLLSGITERLLKSIIEQSASISH